VKSPSSRPPPSLITVAKGIALTEPSPATLLPKTLSVEICCNFSGATPVDVSELVCNSINPFVEVNSVSLNDATPKSD
jgi:hypothetical protein